MGNVRSFGKREQGGSPQNVEFFLLLMRLYADRSKRRIGVGGSNPSGSANFFDSYAKTHCKRWTEIVIDPRIGKRAAIFVLGAMLLAGLAACTSGSPPSRLDSRSEPPRGLFESLVDEWTERECNVFRFSCPYGLGPAGEPCQCTDPQGVVLNGRTVK